MGKTISSQSIVVASTATNWYGHEGRILRYVFLPSIILRPCSWARWSFSPPMLPRLRGWCIFFFFFFFFFFK